MAYRPSPPGPALPALEGQVVLRAADPNDLAPVPKCA